MRDKTQIMDYIAAQGISENDFNDNLRLYSAPFCPTKDTIAAEVEEFKTAYGEAYGVAYGAVSAKDALEMMMGTEATTDEEAIANYAEERINLAPNSQLTMAGIEKAWSDREINGGNPGLMVTRVNQVNPDFHTGPSGLVNINATESDSVTVDELKEKIDYAKQQNPEGPSVLVVGQEGHWTLLAIDSGTREYRYVDSQRSDQRTDTMPPTLKEKLNEVLGADYRDVSGEPGMRNPQPQQDDAVSCGYWVIKNAQAIARDGIRAHVPSAEAARINDFALSVQNKLADTVITSIQRDQHKRAFRGIAAELTMRTGIQNATEISLPTATRIVKPKEEGLSVV